ncbi:hypothetical protein ACP70R_015715 [Stipagrostis hirtigluma subsp. patula]
MKSIIATRGKLKIYVKINRYGQPCGIKTCKFTNFIATLVKGGDISLMHHDWRLVKNKEVIWTKLNKYFVIDPVCKDWVMASASKKWRDFTRVRKHGQNPQGGNKDVALRSLVGSNIVAYGRITSTDKNAKGVDGLPLGDYCEVLVDVVLDHNVLLPRAQGQATKLGSAIGRCIAWPFQNVVQADGSPLRMYRRAPDCGK